MPDDDLTWSKLIYETWTKLCLTNNLGSAAFTIQHYVHISRTLGSCIQTSESGSKQRHATSCFAFESNR